MSNNFFNCKDSDGDFNTDEFIVKAMSIGIGTFIAGIIGLMFINTFTSANDAKIKQCATIRTEALQVECLKSVK